MDVALKLCSLLFDPEESIAVPLAQSVLASKRARTLGTVLTEMGGAHPVFRADAFRVADRFPVIRVQERLVYHPYMRVKKGSARPEKSAFQIKEWIVGSDLKGQLPALLQKTKRILESMRDERDALLLESTAEVRWKCPDCKHKTSTSRPAPGANLAKHAPLCALCGETMKPRVRSTERRLEKLQKEVEQIEELLATPVGPLPKRQSMDTVFPKEEQVALRRLYAVEESERIALRKASTLKERRKLEREMAQKNRWLQWECPVCKDGVRTLSPEDLPPLPGDAKRTKSKVATNAHMEPLEKDVVPRCTKCFAKMQEHRLETMEMVLEEQNE